MICNFYQVLLGIKEGYMGGKCNTHNGDERFVSNFSLKISRCPRHRWKDNANN